VPLPWVRLDTAFPYNPKLLAMLAEKDGHRAGLVYVCSLGYSGAHGTDGFIPREALPFIHGRPPDAERLVRHGFWREQPGGWLIHGWAEFQESSSETQERRKRAQAAAQARWDGHQPSTGAERTRQWRERNGDRARDDTGGTVTRMVT
jgi:hypothetical protein